MKSKSEITRRVIDYGAVAVVRLPDSSMALDVINAIREGGVKAIEITMTVPRALDVIADCAAKLPSDVIIGVGSVLDAQVAQQAIYAGADFVVSPVCKEEIIHTALRYGKPAYVGAFTPSEALRAWEAGSDIVKIFPADVVDMPFFKAVKAPMPQLQLMPTGGVSLTNAGDWIKAGACAVGVGSALLNKDLIASQNWSQLTENAKTLINSINQARS